MPACKIQCGSDQEADCGTCRHRDKWYPWPGGADGKMKIKMLTIWGEESYQAINERFEQLAIAGQAMKSPGEVWSHWE